VLALLRCLQGRAGLTRDDSPSTPQSQSGGWLRQGVSGRTHAVWSCQSRQWLPPSVLRLLGEGQRLHHRQLLRAVEASRSRRVFSRHRHSDEGCWRPESNGRHAQFLKRMIEFADRIARR